MTTLEFDGVTKVYQVRGAGQMKALDDVSFTLTSGQTIGLVGQAARRHHEVDRGRGAEGRARGRVELRVGGQDHHAGAAG